MPQPWLVYDPNKVDGATAEARARLLGIPIVVRGMNQWMQEARVSLGQDGYGLALLCLVPRHNAAREMLAWLTDAAISSWQNANILDHPPDPLSQLDLDKQALDAIAAKAVLTPIDIQTVVQILGRMLG